MVRRPGGRRAGEAAGRESELARDMEQKPSLAKPLENVELHSMGWRGGLGGLGAGTIIRCSPLDAPGGRGANRAPISPSSPAFHQQRQRPSATIAIGASAAETHGPGKRFRRRQ